MIEEAELRSEIRRLLEELGRTPTSGDMDREGRYSSGTYFNRFGTWEDALREAGISGDPMRVRAIEDIQRVAERLGKPPTIVEYREFGEIPASTIRHRIFDSWNEAISAAGFETYEERAVPERDELLDDISRVAEELGRTPTQIDIQEHGRYSKAPFIRKFGSWNEAVKAAGYEPNRK